MILKKHITKKVIIESISMLFILLFVYASISKLLEFKDFQTQLGQSPLLGAFAIPISYSVIGIELITSLFLAIEKTRKWALYLAFMLMIMFTTYIVIILNFTTFTPCSCGGVLESLGWTEHLIFNIVFIILAIIAIHLIQVKLSKLRILSLFGLFALGVITVSGLFLISEQEIKRNNAFIRRYMPHPIEKLGNYDLQNNTYYIAGVDEHYIYLGNYNAPLLVKQVPYTFNYEEDVFVSIDSTHLPYRKVKISINPPYFFLGDGTIPILFRGKMNKWNATLLSYKDAFFTEFKVADSVTIGVTTRSLKNKTNALGLLKKNKESVTFKLYNDIIKPQSTSGTFDSEGMLIWNSKHEKFIYTFFYRNVFEITNKDQTIQTTGNTIDTISQAIVDVALYNKNDAYKLGGNSILVNKLSATYADYLFIHSDRIGRFEDDEVLRSASIIDVYNLDDTTYKFSFYLYHQKKANLNEFRVYKNFMVALVDNKIWLYRLKSDYFKLDSNKNILYSFRNKTEHL